MGKPLEKKPTEKWKQARKNLIKSLATLSSHSSFPVVVAQNAYCCWKKGQSFVIKGNLISQRGGVMIGNKCDGN